MSIRAGNCRGGLNRTKLHGSFARIPPMSLGTPISNPARIAASPLTPDAATIDRFLAHCHRRRYPARADVFRPGDPAGTLYYVVSGSVSIIAEEEDNRELVLGYYGQGDHYDNSPLICRPLTFMRAAPSEHGYARPVEGLIVTFDLDNMVVVDIEDHVLAGGPDLVAGLRDLALAGKGGDNVSIVQVSLIDGGAGRG